MSGGGSTYTLDELGPVYSPFFGVIGASSAMIFTGISLLGYSYSYQSNNMPCIVALGAAYGTAKSGTGIAAMAVMRPELIMKSIIPVVMAGIIAIYGLVVSVIISQKINQAPEYSLYT